jgi:CRISPR-associated endoribonuclease Cas6
MKRYLHSAVIELHPLQTAILPATSGQLTHALFLYLIGQAQPTLATRFHDEPNYRPFTVSSLQGGQKAGKTVRIPPSERCSFRVTLIDDGAAWQCLRACFQEMALEHIQLGDTRIRLHRLLTTPHSDPKGWATYTDWETLANTTARSTITMIFSSPTAFSQGKRQFALLPDPSLVWNSLLRTWNEYAPEHLHMDRQTLRAYFSSHIHVKATQTVVTTLHFPTHPQRGFVGTCQYQLQPGPYTQQITTLAEFARYAGIGYKTTMGMGQAWIEETSCRPSRTCDLLVAGDESSKSSGRNSTKGK